MANAAATPSQTQADLTAVLEETRAESGRTLLELVDQCPVLLVFLRHFGCSFCRQAIDDVSQIQAELQRRGVQAVFVHLGTPERARPYFDYYKLAAVERISNPDASLYHHPVFQLARVHLIRQVFRPSVWKSWLSGALRRHGVGLIREDGFQMPGVFFLRDRAVAASYRHRSIADRPDYLALVS
jgi:hypothetical protein